MRVITIQTVERPLHTTPLSFPDLLRAAPSADVLVVRRCPTEAGAAVDACGAPYAEAVFPGASLQLVWEDRELAVFHSVRLSAVRAEPAATTTGGKEAAVVTVTVPLEDAHGLPHAVMAVHVDAAAALLTVSADPPGASSQSGAPVEEVFFDVPLLPAAAGRLALRLRRGCVSPCCGAPPSVTRDGAVVRLLVDPSDAAGRRTLPPAFSGDAAPSPAALPPWDGAAWGRAVWVRGEGVGSGAAAAPWPPCPTEEQSGDIAEKAAHAAARLQEGGPFERLVTASEFGAASGVGAGARVAAWVDRRAGLGLDAVLRGRTGGGGSEATAHGIRSEPAVRAAYADRFGTEVLYGGFFVPAQEEFAFLGASPDGAVFGDEEDEDERPTLASHPSRLLEIKCPFYRWPNPERWPSCYKGVDPAHYCQVQGQMHIAGVDVCDYVVCFEGAYAVWRVRRCPVFWGFLLERLVFAHRWISGQLFYLEGPRFEWRRVDSVHGVGAAVAGSITPLVPPSLCTTHEEVEAAVPGGDAVAVAALFRPVRSAVHACLAAGVALVAAEARRMQQEERCLPVAAEPWWVQRAVAAVVRAVVPAWVHAGVAQMRSKRAAGAASLGEQARKRRRLRE
eukprot:Rhum_TRINITY_DN15093_c0_g1::Rhum_TRINITY_DN15093_c0_g1_i1::g.136682::m.136682